MRAVAEAQDQRPRGRRLENEALHMQASMGLVDACMGKALTSECRARALWSLVPRSPPHLVRARCEHRHLGGELSETGPGPALLPED